MLTLAAIQQSPEFAMMVKMLISVAAGSIVGLERYQHGHPAGVRTFAIISLTSTLLTASLTQGIYGSLMGEGDMGASRVIQGVLQGIGFIGAGVIVRDGVSVKGLTSAASIWSVAAIGILVGTGEYFLGIAGALFTLVILVAFRRVDALTSRRSFAVIEANFVKGALPDEDQIKARLLGYGFRVSSIAFKGAKSGAMQITLYVWTKSGAAKARHRLAKEFLSDPDITDFSMEPVRD